MTKTTRSLGTLAAVAVVLLAGLALTTLAWAENGGEEKKVEHMVFVGDDGHQVKIDLNGDGHHAWKMHHLGPHGESGAFLGVMLSETTSELRSHLGAPEGAGVLVSKVVEGSAAEEAGLRVGDILAAVDGKTVASTWELRQAVGSYEPGTTVGLEVWRDGQLVNLNATLKESSQEHFGGARRVHKIVRVCDDPDDCDDLDLKWIPGDSPCGDSGECEIQVRCEKSSGDCDCTVNGETVDCATLPHASHDD